jgi:hypothetical protein
MTRYTVLSTGRVTDDGRLADSLPINVDDTTTVHLRAEDYAIVIVQETGAYYGGHTKVTVHDVDALTKALTQAQLVQAERQAMDDRPLTDDMRKAIFAGLRDADLSTEQAARLRFISKVVQRKVPSISERHPETLTRAEARHVIDVLDSLS